MEQWFVVLSYLRQAIYFSLSVFTLVYTSVVAFSEVRDEILG